MITMTLAQARVSSISAAEDWYGRVFGSSLAGAGVLDGYRSGHERTLDHLERFLA